MLFSSLSRRTIILALAGGLLLVSALGKGQRIWAFVIPPLKPQAAPSVVPASPASRHEPAVRPAASVAAPAARPPLTHEDLSGCRPGQDISCTVIRETAGGFIVWTRAYRDGSQAAVIPAPSVSGEGKPGVCVMPAAQALPTSVLSRLPNGAPILD